MAKLSGKGMGKWSSEDHFRAYKKKRSKKNRTARAARKANRCR